MVATVAQKTTLAIASPRVRAYVACRSWRRGLSRRTRSGPRSPYLTCWPVSESITGMILPWEKSKAGCLCLPTTMPPWKQPTGAAAIVGHRRERGVNSSREGDGRGRAPTLMIGQLKAVGSIPGSWLSSAASCVITAWEVKVRVTVSPRLASDSFGTVTVTDRYRPGWTYSAALRGGYQTTWTSARIREPLP